MKHEDVHVETLDAIYPMKVRCFQHESHHEGNC